jgi:hypothetical protein
MRETLLGTVLGDGYLEPHGKGVRLHIHHSERFKSYVDWKREELADLRPCYPHRNENNGYPSWHFVTRSHPELADLRDLFYVNGRKIVPQTIQSLFTHPKSLAVWFMDDGTCDRGSGSFLLETQCFDDAGLERLQDALYGNFGIATTPHQCGQGRKGKRLYVSTGDAQKMASLIEPYILPVFRYKLGFPVTTDGFRPEIGGSASRQIYSTDQTLAPPPLSGG